MKHRGHAVTGHAELRSRFLSCVFYAGVYNEVKKWHSLLHFTSFYSFMDTRTSDRVKKLEIFINFVMKPQNSGVLQIASAAAV